MASAGNSVTVGSATTTELFDSDSDGGKCKKFFVGCQSTSANGVKINVAGIHASGEFVGLPPGTAVEFERVIPVIDNLTVDGEDGISTVTAQGVGGDAVIDFGITSKSNIASAHIRNP